MLTTIPNVFNAQQLETLRGLLTQANDAWVDGRASAGYQGAEVKVNEQLDERSETARHVQHIVLSVLERHPVFISAVLPNVVYPPMVNRYGAGMTFGPHVDGGVRINPQTGRKIRADVSITVFLTDPADYDGGELQVHDTYGMHSVKLEAGAIVAYPASSLHQVTPITRGVRTGCFFWVQSLIRDDMQRSILHDLDNAIIRLNQTQGDGEARRTLVGCYHNLLRQWSET